MDTVDMADMPVTETPVLIVGASMVGMTLATLLAKHEVEDCITIEKHSSTAIHARAALFQPRSMQIYSELGLYDEMERESHQMYDKRTGLFHAESLAAIRDGGKVGIFMKDINDGIGNMSPTSRLFLAQQAFEPLLRKKAEELGADIRFGTELIDFEQDKQGVTALLRDVETSKQHLVKCKYMVGCDGNRSSVRDKLGIQVQGHGLLSHSLTIYFKSDLSRFVKDKYNGVIYINNEDIRGFFRLDKTGREGFLVVNTYGERGTEESRYPADGITHERAAEMLQAAIGEEVDFEISLLVSWRAECNFADTFASGRVLLAGDAAHIITPNGGFGGNTGIQDAHNLAWKLALVLQDKAGADLVEQTYNDERWPVAKKTVDQVFERYVTRTAPELIKSDTELEVEVPEPHLELGYRYHSRGLENKELGGITEDPSTAQALPGSMAHHCLISTVNVCGSGSKEFPIANLFGKTFVLICGCFAQDWM